MFAVALVGFTDAMYLTITRLSGGDLACNITNGCDVVVHSSYATLFGIPVSMLGVAFYLTMIFSAFYVAQGGDTRVLWATSLIAIAGFCFTVWMVYLQLFVIGAICQWCMVSAVTSTVLCGLGIVVVHKGNTSDYGLSTTRDS